MFRALLRQHDIPLRVLSGAEVFAHGSNLRQLLMEDKVVTLNHSRYLLVEFNFQTRPEALCAHMVYIAEEPQNEVMEMQRYGHVTMLLCGEAASENAVCFNEKDYQRQLAEIQI